jgi:hypothetical protein
LAVAKIRMTAKGCAPGPRHSTIHLFELGCRQDSNDGQGLRPGTPARVDLAFTTPLFTYSNLAVAKIRMTAKGCAPGPRLGSNWRTPPPPFTYSNLAVAKIRMTAKGCAPGPQVGSDWRILCAT